MRGRVCPSAEPKDSASEHVVDHVTKFSAATVGAAATSSDAFCVTNGCAAGIDDEEEEADDNSGAHLGGALGSGTLFCENHDFATGLRTRETGEDGDAGVKVVEAAIVGGGVLAINS